MIALTCVLTMIVRIPSPIKGYMNLGDCAVLLGGWLLGPVWGSLAGVFGNIVQAAVGIMGSCLIVAILSRTGIIRIYTTNDHEKRQ